MTANSITRGAKGAEVYFSAVYEGSAELQKISENSVFGDATPNGQLNLVGDFPCEIYRPVDGGNAREFYIDLEPQGGDASDFVLKVPVRKAFQSEPTQYQSTMVTFRYVSDGAVLANLSLSIANPKAIGMLDPLDRADMIIRICDGRRSAAEIAVLEQMLANDEANARTNGVPSYYQKDFTLEQWIERATAHNRRRLALAKGEG
jgi:hypothetical protein